MESPDLRSIESERLLEILQGEAGCPGASYAEAPALLGFGSDALVYGFRLADAPEAWSRPLVVRRLRPEVPARQVHWDAALHASLAAMGFPVPELAISCEADPVLGRFQVMTLLPGRMLLEEIFGKPPAALLRQPLLLARLVREAVFVARARA